MTGPDDQSVNLDRAAIAAQAAALAEHLQRSGVQWLPQARPEQVALLREQMAPTASRNAATSADRAPPAAEPRHGATPAPFPADMPSATAGENTSRAEATPISRAAPRLQPVEAVLSPDACYPGEAIPAAERQLQLTKLEQVVSVCRRCDVLASCRHRTVFGEGSVTPRIAFFGEAPGADEDLSGRPFVGKAGQLLTKMIEACKFQRSDVYIFNTVKCRPPGNRNPEPDEISNCREYYQQQLAILRPEYIVCLGAVSAQELLQSKLSVGRLRGTLHRYFASKVLVTYHPAYLLRNPSAKKAAWEDLQIVLRDAKIQY